MASTFLHLARRRCGCVPDSVRPMAATGTDIGTGREDPKVRRSRLGLAAMLITTGVLHFVAPKPFVEIVPRWLGRPRFWVSASGVAEIASGALLLDRRTARAGGIAATATIVGVYPANIQFAVDQGRPHDPLSVFAWLRLPMQFPMIAWALRHARR